MALTPGTRLAFYEITNAIGAGGMSARGRGERPQRDEPPWRGGGAPRNFLKQTNLAHAGMHRWR
jgi:hypothetical protein